MPRELDAMVADAANRVRVLINEGLQAAIDAAIVDGYRGVIFVWLETIADQIRVHVSRVGPVDISAFSVECYVITDALCN